MKKICFITNSLANGGAQRVISLIAEKMAANGFSVTLLCVNKMQKEYELSNVNIRYLNEYLNVSLAKRQRIKLLRKVLKEEKPDVIISFEYFLNMGTIIASRGLNAKIIVSERNDPAQQKSRKFVNFLRDYLYRKADVLVCQTPDAKAYFSKKVQKHAVVIPNPVKDGLPFYHGQNSKTIINFCRLEKQKNLPLLIDAFELSHKKDNDIKLAIYGDGKERESLLQIVKDKHLEDSVSIYPANTNIHEIVASCKMFVSSSDYEGLSNSMLEAMAMGLPTICTDCPCGGARMVIENGKNGLLVPVGDVDALSKAILMVFANDALATELSNNALKIKEELSQEKITEEWLRLFV